MKTFSQFNEETGKVSSMTQHHHDMLNNKGLSDEHRQHYEKSLPHHVKLDKMTPEKHLEKMEKTRKSIHNHVMAGGSSRTSRGVDLRQRYDDHLDRMKELHPAHWKAHCEKHHLSPHHDGHDLFA